MRLVKIPEFSMGGKDFPVCTVDLSEIDGMVFHEGELIGWVWKGVRVYSPPVRKGSRVARYHKAIPEWQSSTKNATTPEFRRNTRQEAIAYLIGRQAGVTGWPFFPRKRKEDA